jgi:hypothetical protein
MEDLFKVMGDALNPKNNTINDRQVAFTALLKAIDEINDLEIKINIRNRLIDYIKSIYKKNK